MPSGYIELLGLAALHDPEMKRAATAWEMRLLLTAVGLAWMLILLRRRAQFAGRALVLGLIPAAMLWVLADVLLGDRFLLRVGEAVSSWNQAAEIAVAVIGIGWATWSLVLGDAFRSRWFRAPAGAQRP